MNVLVLMTDHHRADALGCRGNPLAHTPHLDRLVEHGMLFENCFTQSPVCAPARHTLATGKYVHAHGVLTNSHKPRPGMFTIAHALQPRGYRRFHLGHMHWTDREMDNGYEPEVTASMWRETMPAAALARYEAESSSPIRRTTGGPGPRTREQFWGYHVACESIRQIEEAVSRGEPFLSWTSFTEPHPPWYPPSEYYRLNDPATIATPPQPPENSPAPHADVIRRQQEWKHLTEHEVRQIICAFYGMVALADDYCGMVLEALERLGVRDETIVIWTADHGEQMYEHGLFTKFVMREASVRVPLVIDLPGHAADLCSSLVEHVDLFPTICELLDIPLPDGLHGRSLSPLLRGTTEPADWRDAVFSQIGDTEMVRTPHWKLNVYRGQPGELFDMVDDPQEFYNRVDDADCAPVVRELSQRLADWRQTHQH